MKLVLVLEEYLYLDPNTMTFRVGDGELPGSSEIRFWILRGEIDLTYSDGRRRAVRFFGHETVPVTLEIGEKLVPVWVEMGKKAKVITTEV